MWQNTKNSVINDCQSEIKTVIITKISISSIKKVILPKIVIMRVYLDNAATTPLDPEVFEAMKPMLLENFGNPSSIHSHGRQVRAALERARKQIGEMINASPGEIFFTSGGTEADNMAIRNGAKAYGIKHAVTTKLEHHAVLHSMDYIRDTYGVQIHYLDVDCDGNADYDQLENILKTHDKVMVSMMHANNEIATKNDIERIGALCQEYDAIFHTDTVQTMGHFPIDVKKIGMCFLAGSAHKFHGPKGVGFIYVNNERKINPLIHGGSQERLMRAGTENVAGIIGMAKALEMACTEMEDHTNHVKEIKNYMMEQIKEKIPGVSFNGMSNHIDNSLYTVLSVNFPSTMLDEMLLFNLDINGISASGGSACTSGSSTGSHVLDGINDPNEKKGPSIRFSFSKFNNKEEVDYVVSKLEEMYAPVLAS